MTPSSYAFEVKESDEIVSLVIRGQLLTQMSAKGHSWGGQDTKNGIRGPWWCPFSKKIQIGIGVLNITWVSEFL